MLVLHACTHVCVYVLHTRFMNFAHNLNQDLKLKFNKEKKLLYKEIYIYIYIYIYMYMYTCMKLLYNQTYKYTYIIYIYIYVYISIYEIIE